jgi:hypothetical protein
MARFFDTAPILSWSSWLRRKCLPFLSLPPTILKPQSTTLPSPPTGIPYALCTPSAAAEYSAFLEAHYCPPNHQARLKLPTEFLINQFQTGVLTGIEVRSSTNQLVGLVFSRRLGYINSEPTRLITWFCISPEWRKKGLADYMLFAIYEASRPTHIFWFRNDGLARSIVPPVWSQQQITRTLTRSDIRTLQQRPHEAFQSRCIEYWKRQNPTGIYIDPTEVFSSLEWYSMETTLCGNVYSYAILVSNLYEYYETDLACEIVYWFPLGQKASEEKERYILEELVSRLPYSRIEAPVSMPHLESLWKSTLSTSWYPYGYDVGIPVLRPILSLTAV